MSLEPSPYLLEVVQIAEEPLREAMELIQALAELNRSGTKYGLQGGVSAGAALIGDRVLMNLRLLEHTLENARAGRSIED